MITAMRSTWALFLGLALIMLANGLQGTLLGVRAGLEGFSTTVTGAIMSGYFVGFLAGSSLAPRLVGLVGHARVFAAMASLASTAALIHAVAVDPYVWFAMRFVTGVSMAGLYVAAESWLNDSVSNESRGKMLATYMIVVLAGIGGGQFLLNLGDPTNHLLFIVASILISLALLPILLSAAPAPDFSAPSPLSLRDLYRLSPLGVVSCFGVGIVQGTLWGMAPVFGEKQGYSIAEITIYSSAIFAGGILFQWPLGWISDRYDRREVLTAILIVASAVAGATYFTGIVSIWPSFVVMLLIGGMCMPSYSICIAHANDFLKPAQMVAASAGLYFIFSVGASLGPFATANVMTHFGPTAFYLSIAVVTGAIAMFSLYRMSRRAAIPLDEQGPSIYLQGGVSPVVTEVAAEYMIEEAEEAAAEEAETDHVG